MIQELKAYLLLAKQNKWRLNRAALVSKYNVTIDQVKQTIAEVYNLNEV